MKNNEFVKWGDEQYSYPNQLGAIKRSYRYLVGSGTGLTGFIKELEAIPDVRYKPGPRASCVLYLTYLSHILPQRRYWRHAELEVWKN